MAPVLASPRPPAADLPSLHFLPCGDCAVSIQLGDTVDAEVNASVYALADAVEAAQIDGIVELVPSYRALLIRYDPARIRGADLETRIAGLRLAARAGATRARRWTIPVVYGGEAGQDLDAIAQDKGMTAAEVVALHASAEYRVFMIGFTPGFAYLGGLPERLHTPRLQKPRQLVPAGSIGIGGQQASINSVAGPSGWRFIGQTPLLTFDPGRAAPFLLSGGDRVRFRPVSAEEGAEIAARVATGEIVTGPEDPA